MVLVIEPRASGLLVKCFTIRLYIPSPFCFLFFIIGSGYFALASLEFLGASSLLTAVFRVRAGAKGVITAPWQAAWRELHS